jgi:hypothetical protein
MMLHKIYVRLLTLSEDNFLRDLIPHSYSFFAIRDFISQDDENKIPFPFPTRRKTAEKNRFGNCLLTS